MLPWWIIFLPRRKGVHPYFGPPSRPYGGPDVKLRHLKKRFGNNLWPNLIYVVTGKPLPLAFIRLARKKKLPVILNQNGVYFPAWYPRGYEKKNELMRRMHELSDYVIYQSRFCQDASQRWVSPPIRKHSILYNAVDTSHYSPAPPPALPLRILASSYFNQSNGYVLGHVLRTVRYLNDQGLQAKLLIAGKIEGGKAHTLPNWVIDLIHQTEMKDNVTYLGWYDQKEAPLYYRQAHLLLHVKYMDPCPSTVLEAMACGLPVVYSASGGTPELVGPAGEGVPVDFTYEHIQLPSIEALGAAIQRVWMKRNDLSTLARERAASEFSIDRWFQTHQQLFAQVLSESR